MSDRTRDEDLAVVCAAAMAYQRVLDGREVPPHVEQSVRGVGVRGSVARLCAEDPVLVDLLPTSRAQEESA